MTRKKKQMKKERKRSKQNDKHLDIIFDKDYTNAHNLIKDQIKL